jgi:hypothetical protein
MIKMKKIILFSICLLCFATACKKMDEGVEDIGKYADQISGFEGTVSYAKDGKPAVGFPVQIQVGNTSGTVRFDPFTGGFMSTPDPNSYSKAGQTDKNGYYKLAEINKNLPIRYGFFSATGYYTASGAYDYFMGEFIINNVSQPLFQVNGDLEFGKVKKIDIKLHEAYKVEFTLKIEKADSNDSVVVKGNWFSPIDGKAVELNSMLQLPKQDPNPNAWITSGVSFGFKSKPNVPLTLKIEHFRNKALKDTRTLVIKMDKKDNNIDAL